MSPHMAVSRNLAATAGAWSARNRRKAIFGWLLFVVVAYLVGGVVGQRNLTDSQMGNGPSGQGTSVFEKAFPYHSGEEVLLQSRTAAPPAPTVVAAAVDDLVGRLRRMKTVADIQSPLPVPGAIVSPALRSADGRSILVNFEVAGNSNQAQTNVNGALSATAAAARDHPQLRVEEFGSASATKALIKAYDGDFTRAEHTSLPVTLLILLVAFGSLVAAGVPLLLGFTAVIGALGLIKPISHLYPVAQGQIEPVVLLVGLAVGVDYSMFYLRRKLEERHRGADNDTALARAAATSGRAVLTSGLTVMTAMAGMLLAGNAVFISLGIGTMLVVAVAVVGSLTVLPAVMARLGDRVEWGRVPFVARRRAEGRSRMWTWLVDRVLRRPLLSVVFSAGVLLLLAAPALNMRTVDPGSIGLPRSLSIVQTYDRIEAAFPGAPMPALVVITAKDVTAPTVRRGVAALSRAVLARSGQMSGPVVETVSSDRTVALVTVALAGSGTDPSSTAALTALRTKVIPDTVGRVAGIRTYVTGTTAGSVDFNQTMRQHLRLVFVFVLGLAFLLLLLAFRSVVIPLVTIVLNLLSVGAAYWGDGAGVPVRASAIPDRGAGRRWGHRLDSAVPPRGAVWPVDGLSRADPQPDPGGSRPGPCPWPGGGRGDHLDSRCHHQRGAGHGGCLRHLRHAERDRLQAARGGPGLSCADRRHHRAHRASPVGDEAPRGVELVPPALARLPGSISPRTGIPGDPQSGGPRMTPDRTGRAAPEIVAPTNRINVALPFSQIKVQEPTPELVELASIVAELARATGDETIRKRAEALIARLR